MTAPSLTATVSSALAMARAFPPHARLILAFLDRQQEFEEQMVWLGATPPARKELVRHLVADDLHAAFPHPDTRPDFWAEVLRQLTENGPDGGGHGNHELLAGENTSETAVPDISVDLLDLDTSSQASVTPPQPAWQITTPPVQATASSHSARAHQERKEAVAGLFGTTGESRVNLKPGQTAPPAQSGFPVSTPPGKPGRPELAPEVIAVSQRLKKLKDTYQLTSQGLIDLFTPLGLTLSRSVMIKLANPQTLRNQRSLPLSTASFARIAALIGPVEVKAARIEAATQAREPNFTVRPATPSPAAPAPAPITSPAPSAEAPDAWREPYRTLANRLMHHQGTHALDWTQFQDALAAHGAVDTSADDLQFMTSHTVLNAPSRPYPQARYDEVLNALNALSRPAEQGASGGSTQTTSQDKAEPAWRATALSVNAALMRLRNDHDLTSADIRDLIAAHGMELSLTGTGLLGNTRLMSTKNSLPIGVQKLMQLPAILERAEANLNAKEAQGSTDEAATPTTLTSEDMTFTAVAAELQTPELQTPELQTPELQTPELQASETPATETPANVTLNPADTLQTFTSKAALPGGRFPPVAATDDTWREPYQRLADRLQAYRLKYDVTWNELLTVLRDTGATLPYPHQLTIMGNASTELLRYRPYPQDRHDDVLAVLDLLEESTETPPPEPPVAQPVPEKPAQTDTPAEPERGAQSLSQSLSGDKVADKAQRQAQQISLLRRRVQSLPTTTRGRKAWLREQIETTGELNASQAAKTLSISFSTCCTLLSDIADIARSDHTTFRLRKAH